jgi:hypothetical protein
MPKPIITHLRTLKRQGVEVDAIWIAHEVQKGRLCPGQPLTVADLMPAMRPRQRPGWHLAVAAVASALGLVLMRGAFGLGAVAGTMPTAPHSQPEAARMPTEQIRRPITPPSPGIEAVRPPERTAMPMAAQPEPTVRSQAAVAAQPATPRPESTPRCAGGRDERRHCDLSQPLGIVSPGGEPRRVPSLRLRG